MVDLFTDIVKQAAQGDMGAFEQIYKKACGFVYSIALRIANNKSDAEEVTQDVFMQIFKNLKNFEFKSSFKTWAYRITVNTAINKYKQASREKYHRLEYESVANRISVMDKTAEFINKESAEERVASFLRVLDPEQRACILLREIEGLSYKEMSEVLKININTVRSRLRRARGALLEGVTKGAITHEV